VKAAYFVGEGRVAIKDVPIPTPKDGEVLIKVHSCGLCGSELPYFEKGYPQIMGHEVSGTVVETGAGTSVPVGTRCAVYLTVTCGRCTFCKSGHDNMCLNRSGSLAWGIPGGYAEYMVVPEGIVLTLDERISLELGVLLLDYLGTTCHGLRLANAVRSTTAAVIGCGPIGLGTIVALKLFGVSTIFGADLSPYRLKEVERLGARPIDAREGDTGGRILEQTWPGVDLVVEASGSPKAWREGFMALRPLGTMLVLGEHQGRMELYLTSEFWHKDCHLVRSWYFPKKEFFENQRMIIESDLDFASLISHRFPLERLQEAMELFRARETTKVLIRCSET